jgi:hypothetical protein
MTSGFCHGLQIMKEFVHRFYMECLRSEECSQSCKTPYVMEGSRRFVSVYRYHLRSRTVRQRINQQKQAEDPA